MEDNEDLEPVWTQVPARKKSPFCGFCGEKLLNNEWHWRYDAGSCGDKKSDKQIYWWCSNCIPKKD